MEATPSDFPEVGAACSQDLAEVPVESAGEAAEPSIQEPPATQGSPERSSQPFSPTQHSGLSPVASDDRLGFTFRLPTVSFDSCQDLCSDVFGRLQGCTTEQARCLQGLAVICTAGAWKSRGPLAPLRGQSQHGEPVQRGLLAFGFHNDEDKDRARGRFRHGLRAGPPGTRALYARSQEHLPAVWLVSRGRPARLPGWCVRDSVALLYSCCLSASRGFFALVAFLENETTRLKVTPDEKHTRTPAIAAMFGSGASRRKSSMLHWIIFLLNEEALPQGLRDGMCMAADGTIRGHRNNFFNYRRSGLLTSEISECYKTSFTDASNAASKLASRSHLNKWLHGEHDKSITGANQDDTKDYLFFHWVVGQIQPVLEVLSVSKGSEIGFPKRFNIVFSSAKPATDSAQETTESGRLLRSFVTWMAANITPTGRVVACDQFARGWLQCVTQAADDFVDNTKGLHSAWEQATWTRTS